MELNELIELWDIDNNAIVLEPRDYFDKGLIGVTEDKTAFNL